MELTGTALLQQQQTVLPALALTLDWTRRMLGCRFATKRSRMMTIHPIAGTHHTQACWVDLCQASTQELAQAEEKVGFALPDRAAIGEIEFSSRVRREGEVLFLNAPRFQDDDGPIAPLGFAV